MDILCDPFTFELKKGRQYLEEGGGGEVMSNFNSAKMGSFILSLDCEGLWGMADNVRTMSSGAISSDSLSQAYNFVERTLDKADIRATAAFVSAFASERAALQEALPKIIALGALEPDWFRLLLPRLRTGNAASLDGLEGHRFWRQLAAAGHDMGWHGSTHLSLADETSEEAVDIELDLARQFGEVLGNMPRSVVFPRNQVGHLSRIKSIGFLTYRESRAGNRGLQRKLTGLVREWRVWDKGENEAPRAADGWVVSPAGHFLNWPSGVRKTVPVKVTVRRWKSILRYAAERGGCVHMWFHPHNLITAPKMQAAFASIMEEVRSLKRSKDLRSLTMADASLYYRPGE